MHHVYQHSFQDLIKIKSQLGEEAMYNERKHLHEDEILVGKVDPETGHEIDPVCGMTVRKHAFYRTTYENKIYKFCNEDCLKAFKEDPMKYIDFTNTDRDKKTIQSGKEENKGCCCNNKNQSKQCCSHGNEE